MSADWSIYVKRAVSSGIDRKFSDEVKADAVTLAEESRGQITTVTKEIGDP